MKLKAKLIAAVALAAGSGAGLAQTPPPGAPPAQGVPQPDNEMSARTRATEAGLRRMAPLAKEQWTPEQLQANEAYKAARKNDVRSGLFMDLLRVPDAMEAAFKMRYYVQTKISFGDKLSQLGMLVVLREWNQRQEFGGHAREAVTYGLNPRIVQAIAEGRYPPGMDADETLIYSFMTEMMRNHNVSDPTYAQMIQRFGERGVIEAVTLGTLYSMVGMTYNVVREPSPTSYPPLPDFPQLTSTPLSAYSDRPPMPPGMPAMPPPRPAAPPPK